MSKPKVQFILTVDTEEEWDWSGPFPNKDFSVRNVFEIPAFQNFCQELGIKPTYLVDYAVANDEDGASILRNLNKQHFEVGAHLHPWANPPFYNETSDATSHVINLPLEHVKQKLEQLVSTIEQNLGVKPITFRTGRWGINGEVLSLLVEEGIKTDSSVYPLYKNEYFSCEDAPRKPYWPDFNNPNKTSTQQQIFEIPVTCGFNRTSSGLAKTFHKWMAKRPFCWLKINGLFWHTLLLRKIYLSPELFSASDMKRLIDTELANGQSVFHMYLHSSNLVQNITGLNSEADARELICERIKTVVEHLSEHTDIEFCTLSQARAKLTTEE